jgi:hypothetical protein
MLELGSAIRSPEAQAVYLRHGIGGTLDPLRLKPATIMELALDLVGFEEGRRLVQPPCAFRNVA